MDRSHVGPIGYGVVGPKQNGQTRRPRLPDFAGRSFRARIQPVRPGVRPRCGSRRPPPGGSRGSTERTGRLEGASESCRRLLVLRVESVKEASPLRAVLDSPDQGGQGVAITAISLEQGQVVFECKWIGGNLDGAPFLHLPLITTRRFTASAGRVLALWSGVSLHAP
jgi:hypothetical protein